MTKAQENILVVDGEVADAINAVDRQLAADGLAVWARPLMAWFHFTGFSQHPVPVLFDPSTDPYSGTNLLCLLEDWYHTHYPPHALMPEGWGGRLLRVRGEVITAQMPYIFPDQDRRDPFKYAPKDLKAMMRILDNNEQCELRENFNRFYFQASDIVLLTIRLEKQYSKSLLYNLVETGWSDIRAIAGAYRPRDPGEVIFLAHQGAEKFLKAFLLSHDQSLSDAHLRRAFGYDIGKLLDACESATAGFADGRGTSWRKMLRFGPQVRYERPDIEIDEILDITNCSFELCHNAASRIGQKLGLLINST